MNSCLTVAVELNDIFFTGYLIRLVEQGIQTDEDYEDLTLCLDYDATGKLGSGVIDGSLVSLGDFGQCKLLSRSLYCLADVTATQQPPGYNNAVSISLHKCYDENIPG